VGEIFMRPHGAGPTYAYIGSPPAKGTPDGFTSVGDLGWVDAEGYLFLADRRVDLIITGGANVYPAEVEAALTEHPSVGDVAVIGVPDEDWGKRVHAVIQPRDPGDPPTVAALDAHCRERLASYKIPKSYEFVAQLPRDDAGKLRRSGLVAEREVGWTAGMIAAPRPGS
jgi:bile acid-coenzyme A ligase